VHSLAEIGWRNIITALKTREDWTSLDDCEYLYDRVQLNVKVNVKVRVVTRSSTTNTASALNSLDWLPIQQRINFKLATLVHRSLHNAGPHCISSSLHPYTPSRQLRSASLNFLSQHCINIALVFRGFRHAGRSLWNLSLIISDLPILTMSSNPI